MRFTRILRRGIAFRHFAAGSLLLTFLSARPTAAQDIPQIEISGGGLLVTDWGTRYGGWSIDAAHNLNKWMAAVARVDGAYGSRDDHFGGSTSWRDHSFQAGARISRRRSARFVPFAQLLVGGLRSSEKSYEGPSGLVMTESNTRTKVSLTPGLGATIMVNPRALECVSSATFKKFPASCQ